MHGNFKGAARTRSAGPWGKAILYPLLGMPLTLLRRPVLPSLRGGSWLDPPAVANMRGKCARRGAPIAGAVKAQTDSTAARTTSAAKPHRTSMSPSVPGKRWTGGRLDVPFLANKHRLDVFFVDN